MTNTTLRTRLGQVRLLQDCSERDRRLVARHLDHLVVEPDTTLIRRGDPPTNLFFVLYGRVEVTGEDGAALLRSGGHVGELALLRRVPSDIDAVTTTSCELGVLGARMFHVLVRDLAPFSRALLADLATRVAQPGHRPRTPVAISPER